MAPIDLPIRIDQPGTTALPTASSLWQISRKGLTVPLPQGSVFSDLSIKIAIDSAARLIDLAQRAETKTEAEFNGHDLPQPKKLDASNQIEVDFYSERSECRVQRLLIEAAERVLDAGDMSERFRVFSGVPAGVPSDAFPERLPHDPVFYLVDSAALNFGHPPCLVMCWVSRARAVFQVVPFAHPRADGEAVIDELMAEIASSA